MELRQLQYFIAAADALNFSRAAESLYISQPTLSQQIAELERELGVQLFIRTKRSVFLTPAGASLLVKAKDLLHRSEALMQSVREIREDMPLGGNLCIGYEPGAASSLQVAAAMSHACTELREQYPGIRIYYKELPTDSTDRALKNGDVDVAITMHEAEKPFASWNTLLLEEQELVYYTYSRNPLPDDRETLLRCLNERTLFLQEREVRGMAQIMSLMNALGVTPQLMFMGALDSAQMIVASGDGALILPESFDARPHWECIRKLHFGLPECRLQTVLAWDSGNLNGTIQLLVNKVAQLRDTAP